MRFTGSCHCGRVKFEAEMEVKNAISCNCSICTKKGSLLAFVPEAQFKLVSGEDSLSTYQFNKKIITHYFCSHCGISPFGAGKIPDGTPTRAINIRCLDGIDLDKIPIEKFDGRSLN